MVHFSDVFSTAKGVSKSATMANTLCHLVLYGVGFSSVTQRCDKDSYKRGSNIYIFAPKILPRKKLGAALLLVGLRFYLILTTGGIGRSVGALAVPEVSATALFLAALSVVHFSCSAAVPLDTPPETVCSDKLQTIQDFSDLLFTENEDLVAFVLMQLKEPRATMERAVAALVRSSRSHEPQWRGQRQPL
ncbi:hypothetical protein SAY86_025715 [Trapa natans]|uniref:Uncharacterized protein n=1 Tax=Trapa natans TaxID=22666 RepID=A0AAN7KCC5_TRANT|nr:hypothetical protein SAY86_025715 [Trapa natans]